MSALLVGVGCRSGGAGPGGSISYSTFSKRSEVVPGPAVRPLVGWPAWPPAASGRSDAPAGQQAKGARPGPTLRGRLRCVEVRPSRAVATHGGLGRLLARGEPAAKRVPGHGRLSRPGTTDGREVASVSVDGGQGAVPAGAPAADPGRHCPGVAVHRPAAGRGRSRVVRPRRTRPGRPGVGGGAVGLPCPACAPAGCGALGERRDHDQAAGSSVVSSGNQAIRAGGDTSSPVMSATFLAMIRQAVSSARARRT